MKLFYRKKSDSITPETPQNAYLEAISARFGILQVLLYVSLLVFVVLSFLANTDLITYRNFYYFFKDLNTSFESLDQQKSDSVSYTTSDEQSFVLYRNGLAVAGNHSVNVFTETGRQTLSRNISYKHPIAVGSGKYLLVYEMGGTQYSLYNSYTEIHSGKADHPLQDAAVSSNGMYALVTSSEEYTSVVSLYDSNFSLINRYNKTGYVMDTAINEKGTQIALLTTKATDGVLVTEIVFHRPGEGGAGTSVSVGNSLGLQCVYTSSGGIGVLCRDRYTFIKEDKTQNTFSFGDQTIATAHLYTDGAAMILRSETVFLKNLLIVFDKDGKMLYNEVAPTEVNQIAVCSGMVFMMHSEGVMRLNIEKKSFVQTDCDTEKKFLLVQSEREFILCSPQKADFLRIS